MDQTTMAADALGRTAPWIAYITANHFPWGQAGSRRVNGMARALAKAGLNVVVASGGNSSSQLIPLRDVDGSGSIRYLGLGELPIPAAGTRGDSLRIWLRRGQRAVDWLESQQTRPSHVLVYGGSAQYAARLRRWCSRARVPLIADVADWPDRQHVRGGLFGPANMTSKAALRYYYPRFDGIIAISSFLEEYFRGRGCRVLRIPPTLDVLGLAADLGESASDVHSLSLVYFGTPEKKDQLADMIRAVDRVGQEQSQLEFRIYGPTASDVQSMLGVQHLPAAVTVMGKLPQPEVGAALQKADFSLILRRPGRLTQAGFPTKFCESLANGTPVITNITSDLGSYFRDGIEGLVCYDHSVDALADALLRALRLGHEERATMRWAARQRALESFDYRHYAGPLSAFLVAAR